MQPLANSPWLDFPRPNPSAGFRLFCFPYAGGGAGVFRAWPKGLPSAYEVAIVRLPGREMRWREPAFTRTGPLISALSEALHPYLDRPFAFFGHSMGALIAFELTRRLIAQGGRPPLHLFVAGKQAPFVPRERKPLRDLPDPEFRAELQKMGGTPVEVLENRELMELLSPMLRADFSVVETYEHIPGEKLDCPVTVFGGLDDPETTREGLDAWRALTTGGFQLRMLPGNHFFIHSAEQKMLRFLSDDLQSLADRTRPPLKWPVAAAVPVLADDEVHIWAAALEQPPEPMERFRLCLSDDERERAARFYFERDRRHFIAGRGILRQLLGRYTGRDSRQLRFQYSPEGKPALAENPAGVTFNLAHSHGLALFAFARNRSVGVDVEYLRADIEADDLAQNFFSAREIKSLRAIPESLRREAFFNCWSRKEAFLKGIGKGLSLALSSFDVSLEPGSEAALLETRHNPAAAERWSLRELRPATGFAAALATEGHGARIWTGQWTSETAAPV